MHRYYFQIECTGIISRLNARVLFWTQHFILCKMNKRCRMWFRHKREPRLGLSRETQNTKSQKCNKYQIEIWRMGKWKNRKISDWRDADWFWPDGHQYPISSQRHTDTLTVWDLSNKLDSQLFFFLIFLAINVLVKSPDGQYRLSFPWYYMNAALSSCINLWCGFSNCHKQYNKLRRPFCWIWTILTTLIRINVASFAGCCRWKSWR